MILASCSSLLLRSSSSVIAFQPSAKLHAIGSRKIFQSSRLFSTTPKSVDTSGANNKPLSNTGGLRRLPVVKSPKELMDKARKVPLRVKTDANVKNIRNRARKHGAESLNALTQALCVPLRDVVNGYKREWRRLHPFERVVADLTARARQKQDGLTLQDVLQEIHEARKTLLEAGKEWVYKAKHAETAKEANMYAKEGAQSMLDMYQEFAFEPVTGILELQRSLRSAPAVQLDTPAIVLVGAPNVGKSSIVRYISSATPEVNNYPFTTRGMTLGHVEVFWTDGDTIARAVVPEQERKRKGPSEEVLSGKYAFSQLCQVMDSPGLLVRPEIERNEMEELTLAAMRHLPTAVMYVLDLSGEAGDKCSSVEDQLQLRRDVRARFPRRPWIDVVSKIDLGIVEDAEEELQEILDGAPYIRLSIQEGEGIEELRHEVLRMLGEVRVVLDAMATVDERSARA
jgi:nucleolar GTP-binding protein